MIAAAAVLLAVLTALGLHNSRPRRQPPDRPRWHTRNPS